MVINDQIVHIHEWYKTDERNGRQGTRYTCQCGEEAWSQRKDGPYYQGPFGWSDRELEAIYWLIEGLNTRQSARAMGLDSSHTSVYLKNARRKAGVSTTRELIDIYRLVYPDVE